MNFDELSKIVAEETGQKVCVICGMPYTPRSTRQKTCGNEGCKHAWKKQYQLERMRRLREEDPDEWRRYHREAQKRSRDKHRHIDSVDTRYRQIEERYKRIEESNKNVTGIDYGKRQAAKTLASIPKIDVNIEGGKKYDDVHSKNNTE